MQHKHSYDTFFALYSLLCFYSPLGLFIYMLIYIVLKAFSFLWAKVENQGSIKVLPLMQSLNWLYSRSIVMFFFSVQAFIHCFGFFYGNSRTHEAPSFFSGHNPALQQNNSYVLFSVQAFIPCKAFIPCQAFLYRPLYIVLKSFYSLWAKVENQGSTKTLPLLQSLNWLYSRSILMSFFFCLGLYPLFGLFLWKLKDP